MKITKEELKELIKEEYAVTQEDMLNENPAAIIAKLAPLAAKYGPILLDLLKVVKENPELVQKLVGIRSASKQG